MARSSPRLLRRMRGCFMFMPTAPFFAGILAAIAIPAYQDYTIRAQTTEGLNLASAAKAAVAESYATTGKWPVDSAAAGLEGDIRGKYVDSVTVDHGTITIVYGGSAHAQIAGTHLTLHPTVSPREDVIWSCGYHADGGTAPRTGAAPAQETTTLRKYLPKLCRE